MKGKNFAKVTACIPGVDERDRLRRLLDEYDSCQLECDGMTRVLAYVLAREGVPFVAYAGRVQFRRRVFAPHWWIVAGEWTVDYRLRMWFGPSAPHGVFRAEFERARRLSYDGTPTDVRIGRAIFGLLSGRE